MSFARKRTHKIATFVNTILNIPLRAPSLDRALIKLKALFLQLPKIQKKKMTFSSLCAVLQGIIYWSFACLLKTNVISLSEAAEKRIPGLLRMWVMKTCLRHMFLGTVFWGIHVTWNFSTNHGNPKLVPNSDPVIRQTFNFWPLVGY